MQQISVRVAFIRPNGEECSNMGFSPYIVDWNNRNMVREFARDASLWLHKGIGFTVKTETVALEE